MQINFKIIFKLFILYIIFILKINFFIIYKMFINIYYFK